MKPELVLEIEAAAKAQRASGYDFVYGLPLGNLLALITEMRRREANQLRSEEESARFHVHTERLEAENARLREALEAIEGAIHHTRPSLFSQSLSVIARAALGGAPEGETK